MLKNQFKDSITTEISSGKSSFQHCGTMSFTII